MGKNKTVAIILSVLLGGLGVDRFYLGYIGTGILKLILLGGFGIWYLIDIIRIATGSLKPKEGEYETENAQSISTAQEAQVQTNSQGQ